MNDFTKEELMIFKELLVWDDDTPSDIRHPIINKIHSMIENYCEHEERTIIGGWVSECVKCGMRFGDETQ